MSAASQSSRDDWLPTHGGGITGLATWEDAGGRRCLATSGSDGALCCWEAETGRSLWGPLTEHEGRLFDVVVWQSAAGVRLVSAGSDGILCTWDARTGMLIGRTFTESVGVRSLACASGFKTSLVATGSYDGSLRVWDMETSTPLGNPLATRGAAITAVTFCYDKENRLRLVAVGDDGVIRIWDPMPRLSVGCVCRKVHPYNSGGMFVLMEDAAEALVSSYVQLGDLVRISDRWGSGCGGRAFAMPWCGRWPL
jgi:WD40 repeat protein